MPKYIMKIKDNKIYVQTKSVQYLEFLSDINNMDFNVAKKNEEIKEEWVDPIKVRFTTKYNILRGIIQITFPVLVSTAWENAIIKGFENLNNIYTIALINVSRETSLRILWNIKHIK